MFKRADVKDEVMRVLDVSVYVQYKARYGSKGLRVLPMMVRTDMVTFSCVGMGVSWPDQTLDILSFLYIYRKCT